MDAVLPELAVELTEELLARICEYWFGQMNEDTVHPQGTALPPPGKAVP